MMRIEFKTERIKKEFSDKRLDKRLLTILYFIMGFIGKEVGYGNYVLITDIFRTNKEQIGIYGGKMPLCGNIHGCWRAIDFILKNAVGDNWNIEQCKSMEKIINQNIRYNRDDKYKTCIFHAVQIGDKGHFHIQTSWKNETLLRRF